MEVCFWFRNFAQNNTIYYNKNVMKHRFIITMLTMLLPLSLFAAGENKGTISQEYRYAFSREGVKEWSPEFTVRYTAGLGTMGPSITGGVRVDNKRTFGLKVGHGITWIDALPAKNYSIQAAVVWRRYFYLGEKDVVALYSDLSLGVDCIYKVTSNNPAASSKLNKPGDVSLYVAFEPGVRFRLYKNLHIFVGPTISYNVIGGHLGIGF